jgi:UDP-3-O-[3-hydroxymyristoyl] glucosamine N-acyltransferase
MIYLSNDNDELLNGSAWKPFDYPCEEALRKRFIAIREDAVIGDGVRIDINVCIGKGAVIGERAIIRSGVCIDAGVRIGKETLIQHGAHIFNNAVIGTGAHIENGVKICRDANIGDTAYIGEGSVIDAGVLVGEHAQISSRSYIASGVVIGNYVYVPPEAHIGHNCHIKNGSRPIIVHIDGPRFAVNYWGSDEASIGCTTRKIDDWFKDYTQLAEENDVTEAEIAEYRRYMTLIKRLHEGSAI